ncbi:hypothetical protein SD81_027585 [Tolypothrix campylonemoides VB511288]|nr:hypothetical protein SD81_027585 [Tolypothrix campylonemoides VB511288]
MKRQDRLHLKVQRIHPTAKSRWAFCSRYCKNRIDLTIDPPPDLAIEIDITSRTQFNNYEIMGVPELWRYTPQGLQINLLQQGKYVEASFSPNFPGIPIIQLVNEYVKQCLSLGRSQAIRAFKSWVKDNL